MGDREAWVGIDRALVPNRVDRPTCSHQFTSVKQYTLPLNLALLLVSDEVVYIYY